MTFDITKLNHEVAERYETAPTVRAVVQRMGAINKVDWQSAYEAKYPPKKRNARNKRIFEADHRVELGAPDTEAPFLIDHHLKNASSTGSSWILQIFQETRMNLPGGNKIKSLHKRVRSIPEQLRVRVDPAMHIARKEIDPEGVFAAEYSELQTAFEYDIDAVINHYNKTLASSNTSAPAKKRLRDETIKELERLTRAQWAQFEKWINQAQHYLTGRYVAEEVVTNILVPV